MPLLKGASVCRYLTLRATEHVLVFAWWERGQVLFTHKHYYFLQEYNEIHWHYVIIITDPVYKFLCHKPHHCLIQQTDRFFVWVCVCVHSGWLLFWQWCCGWCGRLLEVCQSKTNQSCLYFLALPLSALQSCSNQAAQKSQQLSSNAPNCSPGTMHWASVGCWSRDKVKAHHHEFHFSVYQQPHLTFTGNCLYWSRVCVLSHHWNPVLFGGVWHASWYSPPRQSSACMCRRMVRRWQSQRSEWHYWCFKMLNSRGVGWNPKTVESLSVVIPHSSKLLLLKPASHAVLFIQHSEGPAFEFVFTEKLKGVV